MTALRRSFAVGAGALKLGQSLRVADTLGDVKARPGKPGRWYIDFGKRKGRTRRIYSYIDETGHKTAFVGTDGLQKARTVLSFIRAQVAIGKDLDVAIDHYSPSPRADVLTLADEYVEKVRRKARNEDSARNVESLIRHHWQRWRGVSVYAVRTGHLEDWVEEMRATPRHDRKGRPIPGSAVGDATVQRNLATFRAFLGWLHYREVLPSVPPFPTVTTEKRVTALMTWAQQDQVLEAIPERKRGAFILLCDLGLRPSTARALHVVDYDPERRVVSVHRAAKGARSTAREGGTKTGSASEKPVSERFAKWAATWVPAEARLQQRYLFPSPSGGMYHAKSLYHLWKRACDRARVPYVPLRDATRHSTATALYDRGEDLERIQRLLDHRSIGTTRTYVQGRPGQLVDLVRRGRVSIGSTPDS